MSKIHIPGVLYSRWLRAASVVILLVLVLATPVVAGNASLTLAWDASSGVDGYIVEWGKNSGAYMNKVDVGDVTCPSSDDLRQGGA